MIMMISLLWEARAFQHPFLFLTFFAKGTISSKLPDLVASQPFCIPDIYIQDRNVLDKMLA